MSNCRTVVILSVAEVFEPNHTIGRQISSAELARLSDVVGGIDGQPGSDYADCLLADGTLVTCSRTDTTRTVMMVLPAEHTSARDGVAAVEFALILPLMLLLYLGSAETTQSVMASRKAAVAARTLTDLVSQQSANTNMTDAVMADIFNAASAIMQPFTTGASALSLNVAAVSFTAYTSAPSSALKPYVWVPSQSATASTYTPTTSDPGYAAKVRWSVSPATLTGASGLTLTNSAAITRTCGTGVNPLTPSTTAVSSTDATKLASGLYGSTPLVLADVQYKYTPNFGTTIFNWTGQFNWNLASGMTSYNTTFMQPRNSWSACTGGTDAWICYPTRQSPSTCASY